MCIRDRWSKTQKQRPSSDCRLQLACTKSELLVIVDQMCIRDSLSMELARSGYLDRTGIRLLACKPETIDRAEARELFKAVSYTHLDVYKRQPVPLPVPPRVTPW